MFAPLLILQGVGSQVFLLISCSDVASGEITSEPFGNLDVVCWMRPEHILGAVSVSWFNYIAHALDARVLDS
jgi:hypothetical protein